MSQKTWTIAVCDRCGKKDTREGIFGDEAPVYWAKTHTVRRFGRGVSDKTEELLYCTDCYSSSCEWHKDKPATAS